MAGGPHSRLNQRVLGLRRLRAWDDRWPGDRRHQLDGGGARPADVGQGCGGRRLGAGAGVHAGRDGRHGLGAGHLVDDLRLIVEHQVAARARKVVRQAHLHVLDDAQVPVAVLAQQPVEHELGTAQLVVVDDGVDVGVADHKMRDRLPVMPLPQVVHAPVAYVPHGLRAEQVVTDHAAGVRPRQREWVAGRDLALGEERLGGAQVVGRGHRGPELDAARGMEDRHVGRSPLPG